MIASTLFAKVALLLTGSMMLGGLGAYCGRNLRTLGSFILIALLFIGGAIAIPFAAKASPLFAIGLLSGWTFVSGLFIGPVLQMYSQRLGWQTVSAVFLGTGGVMAGCGLFGALSGIDFSFLGGILGIALFGLILVGLVTIFWKLSRTGRLIESTIGMLVFSGYFIFDFFRLSKSENTWEAAINLSMQLYLDFLNFFLYALQFIEALSDK